MPDPGSAAPRQDQRERRQHGEDRTRPEGTTPEILLEVTRGLQRQIDGGEIGAGGEGKQTDRQRKWRQPGAPRVADRHPAEEVDLPRGDRPGGHAEEDWGDGAGNGEDAVPDADPGGDVAGRGAEDEGGPTKDDPQQR